VNTVLAYMAQDNGDWPVPDDAKAKEAVLLLVTKANKALGAGIRVSQVDDLMAKAAALRTS
jgi:hypothetical protein